VPTDAYACIEVSDSTGAATVVILDAPLAVVAISDALTPVDVTVSDAPLAALVLSDARCES
jgi:hypothetical protein